MPLLQMTGMPDMSSNKWLDGIVVSEFANYITGPLAAQMLGDMGARVIKVEPPTGDGMRRLGNDDLTRQDSESVGYTTGYQAYNRNKKSICVDLRTNKGREIATRLLRISDVVIENMRPGVADRLGIGYEDAKRQNERVIYCSINGFGNVGPSSGIPMFDSTAQALSGVLGLLVDTCDPKPIEIPLSDNISGMYAAYGVLGALIGRVKSGQGARITVPMVAANFSFIAESITRLTKSDGKQDVSRVAQAQTFVFDCADGKMLAVQLSTRQKFWDALVKVVGDPLLRKSGLFETDELRVQNYDRLYETLRPLFRRLPVDAWLSSLGAADIPSARVLSVREVAGAEENVALKLLDEIVQPKFGSIYVPASPIQIDGADKLPPTAPPMLGQQTRQILSELGYSSAELTSMISSGVVRA